jgi:endonuclease-3
MPRESKKSKQLRSIEICRRMEERYGQAESALEYTSPYTLLIAVMLSAQTTDLAVNKVTPQLFSRWPGPKSSRALPSAMSKPSSILWVFTIAGTSCRRTRPGSRQRLRR